MGSDSKIKRTDGLIIEPVVLTNEELAEKEEISARIKQFKYKAFKMGIIETICPVCNKRLCFSQTIERWQYKRYIHTGGKHGRSILVCSYSCVRKLDRLYGDKSLPYRRYSL